MNTIVKTAKNHGVSETMSNERKALKGLAIQVTLQKDIVIASHAPHVTSFKCELATTLFPIFLIRTILILTLGVSHFCQISHA